jgi:4-hydroxy-2-oxoheptanedioate aldolase
MVPQVDTVEQAKHIVSAKLFGSKVNGTRSWPPGRWLTELATKPIDPTITFPMNHNEQAALCIQIESITGVNNLDAILTECGEFIDGVWLGTIDLRASMGLDGPFGPEPEYLAAVAKYEAIVKKHNKPLLGYLIGPPELQAQQAVGKSFLIVAWDMYTLMGASAPLAHVRENVPATDWSAVNAVAAKERAASGK